MVPSILQKVQQMHLLDFSQQVERVLIILQKHWNPPRDPALLCRPALKLSPGCEKIFEQLRALVREYAGSHFNAVVQTRVPQYLQNRSRCSRFGISRAKDEPGNTRMDHGSRAHRARFDSGNHRAT